MVKIIPDLSVQIGQISLKNPVMPASGTFGYGEELADFVDLNELGAIIVKGTAEKPRMGRLPNRFTEIAGCCFLCPIGLQGIGAERFISEKLPYLRQFKTPLIVNICGESVDEFIQVTRRLSEVEGISGLEINISCPNVNKGGMFFGKDPEVTYEIVRAVKKATHLTVISKLTPNVTDITVFAKASEAAGADAISLINGLGTGMVIDINTRRSKIANNLDGGIGGPWIKPLALRLVHRTVQVVKIPVIGMGGITCAEDALEFLIAGATAIEIGTHNLVEPRAMINTIQGIRKYLIDKGISSVKEIIGSFIAPN